MICRIGTLSEFDAVKEQLPPDIAPRIEKTVKMIDQQYGADRDVAHDDGGYILFVDTQEDLLGMKAEYFDLCSVTPEEVCYLSEDYKYLNATILFHNEFCVSLILDTQTIKAPTCLLREIERQTRPGVWEPRFL